MVGRVRLCNLAHIPGGVLLSFITASVLPFVELA
jgi:hypothetical protein